MRFELPKTAMRYLKATSGDLVLSGRNLTSLANKYPGLDPENGGQTSENNWDPPPLRFWIARVNLAF
jgi:hypothetical protein